MRSVLLVACLCLPGPAVAAGGGGDTPKPATCKNGLVWNDKAKACVHPGSGALDDADRMDAIRSYAASGAFADAQIVLAALSDPESDLALTYCGFTARKLGDIDAGMACYRRALLQNPDNHLARSYMGQALAEAGEVAAARAQLREIRRRGGRETWAEISLERTLATGRGYSY